MQIAGEWYLCADGVERPVIRGEVLATDGTWIHTEFLLDTGADCTVFSSDLIDDANLPPSAGDRLGGLGGLVQGMNVTSEIRLTRDGDGRVLFRGTYAGMTDPDALEMSVLGRDITGHFAVIVDQPGNVVSMVGQRHTYRIVPR